MTWYLKYRPQKVEELDLVRVREALKTALAAKQLPHAWLFAGPRGLGKTSAARIVAKTLNPDLASEIEIGSAVDVVEIDAASNRGIDEIRELKEKIKLAPMRAVYKVYIIDEVHMLTTEAANALLKTLEEPPAKTVFILCTTDAHKLPETVVSRCTVIKFAKPSITEITTKLEQIAKKEKLTINNEQITIIAQAAKGSFRDAVKLLEQAAVAGKPVEEVLGVVQWASPEEFVALVQAGQTDQALQFIERMVNEGGNVRTFIEQSVEVLRQKLLETKDKNLLPLITDFETAYIQTKEATVPQLPLEILVIKNAHNAPSDPPLNLRGGRNGGDIERVSGDGNKLDELVKVWPDLLKLVKPHNHSVEALLRSTKPLAFDGQTLTLEVFYKFHKDKLETEKCRQIIENALSELFGRRGKLVFQLGTKSKKEAGEDLAKLAEEIFK